MSRLSQKCTTAVVRYVDRQIRSEGTFAGIVTGTAVIMLGLASSFSDMMVSRQSRLTA